MYYCNNSAVVSAKYMQVRMKERVIFEANLSQGNTVFLQYKHTSQASLPYKCNYFTKKYLNLPPQKLN